MVEDATVAKYLAMGHSKEAVQYALQTFGDDQTKVSVHAFCSYLLRLTIHNTFITSKI